MEESRKQFDEWYNRATEGADAESKKMFELMMWTSWVASRAAVEIELPPVCDAHQDDTDKGYDICHYRTQEYLNKQGFKFSIEGADRWAGLRVKEK